MILTKEQCLSEELNPQSSAINLEDVHLRDAVFYGMDLYAEDFFINAITWMCKENYGSYSKGTQWTNGVNFKTPQEIFKEYLQSINQK